VAEKTFTKGMTPIEEQHEEESSKKKRGALSGRKETPKKVQESQKKKMQPLGLLKKGKKSNSPSHFS